MKTIKRSTLRELTRLVRERAKHPEWSGRLWKEAVSVSMMLSRQATGNDRDIMEFAELANAIAGRFGIKPNCTDEELEELLRWLGVEIDESEYGKYIDREAFLEHMKKTDRYFAVKYDIENFPSADVAPVAGRAKAFGEAFVKYANEIAELVVEDSKSDKDIEYAKAVLDRRMREIVGEENFSPFDERYGGDFHEH